MWAQSWVSIVDLVLPFPRKPLRTSRRSWKASAGSWRKCSKRLKNSSPPWGCFPLLPSSGNNQCLERPTDGWEVECTPPHGTSMMARTSG
ncbi:Angiotensin-converting enzyme [Manis javanica]|nr:Angiotensin-converting enzyme [Manis javanica]